MRTRRGECAAKSCRKAACREVGGKSVSASAATGVGAAVGGWRRAVAQPPPGEGDGGEQEHRVGEVDALHEDAHVGGIALDIAAFDEERAEERFGDEKDAAPDYSATGAVAARAGDESPADEHG